MANELVLSASLSYTRPLATAAENQSGSVGMSVVDLFSDAGPEYLQGYQSVAETTPTALEVGAVTPGYVWIQNVGDEFSVDVIFFADGDPELTLAPGQLGLFPCAAGVTLFISGNDGTATVRYLVIAAAD